MFIIVAIDKQNKIKHVTTTIFDLDAKRRIRMNNSASVFYNVASEQGLLLKHFYIHISPKKIAKELGSVSNLAYLLERIDFLTLLRTAFIRLLFISLFFKLL